MASGVGELNSPQKFLRVYFKKNFCIRNDFKNRCSNKLNREENV